MHTSFGKFIEKGIFGRILLVIIYIGLAYGAIMNGWAMWVAARNPWLAVAAGVFYTAIGVLTLMQRTITEKWKSKRLEAAMGFSACFFIYDFSLLLFWGILDAIFPISESAGAIGVLGADVLAGVTVAGGRLYARRVKRTAYSIGLGLKEPAYRIAMLSDIHLGVFVREKHVQRIVDEVNKIQADAVVICGDIIDSNHHILEDEDALAKISAAFRKIQAREGVFAVLGNHDPDAGDERFGKFLRCADIRLLDNQVARLSRINLVGRTNACNNERAPIDVFSKEIEKSLPVVVLDHDPRAIPEAVEFGADLVLSGHTHRGQFFPMTYFTKLANGKHYFYGCESFGKTRAVISSGAGFFQLPVRIGTSNEVVDIQLV